MGRRAENIYTGLKDESTRPLDLFGRRNSGNGLIITYDVMSPVESVAQNWNQRLP
jgi:hypothetical protein